MKDTIEKRTSQAILQEPVEIRIGEETYQVAPPSTATLILASAAISELPSIDLNSENIASESLYIVKDCRVLGEILAILILGAKNLHGTKKVAKTRFFGLLKEDSEITINRKTELADNILMELSPKQVSETFAKLLSQMELAFFFGTITSLVGINLTRATKTTASGQ